MHQQLWGYKVEEKLYLGVREQKRLGTTVVEHQLVGFFIIKVESVNALSPYVYSILRFIFKGLMVLNVDFTVQVLHHCQHIINIIPKVT
jgi:hypothetical protein